MAASVIANHERRTTNNLQGWFLSEYLVPGLTVLLFIALAPFTPGLATGAGLLSILGYLLPLLVVAIGMTLVMITGGIDLSVTSIIALASVVGAKLMTTDGGGAPSVVGLLVVLTGRLETGSPVLGREILLDIIGATVVGGTSLFGGKGKIAWTFFGVLFLTALDNALNLMSLSQFSITMTKGAVILFAAVLDATRRRFARQNA